MNHKVCPLCQTYVKVDESGRFIQHNSYHPRSGTWNFNKICKKSGKKAK